VLGGRSAFYLAPVNVALGLLKDGKLNALGVSTRTRAEVLPQVPPLAEQGLANYEVTLWFGVWAPGRTPAAVVRRISATVNAIVQEPQVREQFAKLGMQPAPMKPEEFARFVRAEIDVYKRIVQQAKIEPQ
jgi:tripartite-type tricarboxylate transporter receptor subunit TctC